MSAPRYEHDCTVCTFLGQHGQADLYFCPQGSHPTVIARYSGDGPDYQSGLDAGKKGLIPDLAEAYRRATDAGLLHETPRT